MKKILILALAILSTNTFADQKIGVSLGTPAAFNFVYKGEINNLPIQVSGAYWGDTAKGLEVGYRFMEQDTAFSSAQFVIGHSQIEDKYDRQEKWSYVGVSATFEYKGFYIEPGLSIGDGDFSSHNYYYKVVMFGISD